MPCTEVALATGHCGSCLPLPSDPRPQPPLPSVQHSSPCLAHARGGQVCSGWSWRPVGPVKLQGGNGRRQGRQRCPWAVPTITSGSERVADLLQEEGAGGGRSYLCSVDTAGLPRGSCLLGPLGAPGPRTRAGLWGLLWEERFRGAWADPATSPVPSRGRALPSPGASAEVHPHLPSAPAHPPTQRRDPLGRRQGAR